MSNLDYSSDQKTIQDMVHLYRNGALNLEPGFQRSSVWQPRDRERLIDSILRNYPLPSIFLYQRPEEGELVYDVIDGKQRIESILMFMGEMRGRFWTKTELPGYEDIQWVNWGTLKRKKCQHKFLGYKLQAIEVKGDTGDIIDLFVRINSTGKALSGAEKRHAKYYKSNFLKKSAQLARRYEDFFLTNKILSPNQIRRMKHVELLCELMVSAHAENVINKKAALDKVMESNSIDGRQLDRLVRFTITALNRLRKMFPRLGQTRFSKFSDFYTLAVLTQKFERGGLILADRRRNRLASDLLTVFSNGVDEVKLLQKKAQGIKPHQELYRDYLLTVVEGTDDLHQRYRREQILRGLLESLFEKKDSRRLFSAEQRRLLWNTTAIPRCETCKKNLSWEDFTIDHIDPYSKGGRTQLENAGLMCRAHNSSKGSRRRRAA